MEKHKETNFGNKHHATVTIFLLINSRILSTFSPNIFTRQKPTIYMVHLLMCMIDYMLKLFHTCWFVEICLTSFLFG